MKQFIVPIKSIKHITHDVLKIVTEKPEGYRFKPGQATAVSINKPDWKNKKNPFTFTCLPLDPYLEFTIKTYPSHKGVTNELLHLTTGDTLIIREVFGAIQYKGEGVFIAGGAGVTPFISIFRDLQSKKEIGRNKLIFANKKKEDILHEAEFKQLLGDQFINILSDEQVDGYAFGRITSDFLVQNSGGIDQLFYLCGPPPMMEAIEKQLIDLHVVQSSIIKEAF